MPFSLFSLNLWNRNQDVRAKPYWRAFCSYYDTPCESRRQHVCDRQTFVRKGGPNPASWLSQRKSNVLAILGFVVHPMSGAILLLFAARFLQIGVEQLRRSE